MNRVDKLIRLIRERTKNLDFTYDATTGITSSGISDNLILEYLNAAQQHLQAAIVAQFPNEFIYSATISLVANQEEYTIPDNVFVNNKVVNIQICQNALQRDYYDLPPAGIRDRDTSSGFPQFYIRRAGKLLLNPVPRSSTGSILVQYYRRLSRLDIRRGTIQTKTGDLTSITLDSATKGNYPFEVDNSEYLTVVDWKGTPTCNSIPVSSYSSSTGVITMRSGFSIPSGSSIAAGDYIVRGKYATTHSGLPDDCERYLLTYAQKRILTTDTAETSVEEDVELKTIEADILQSFAQESRDVTYFPISDDELLS